MTMDGTLLTNSQEEQLLGELQDYHMDDLQFSVSGLIYPDSGEKYNNSQQYATCGSEVIDNKVALHQSLALHSQYEINSEQMQQQQLEHQQQEQELQQQLPLVLYQPAPVAQTPILGKEEFSGNYNFQLILKHQENGKHWIYSEKLSKVFIHMEEVLPLQFQWTPPEDGLWLRATLVYKLDQYRSEPVVRCHNHMAPTNSSNRDINKNDLKHVVRCLHTTSIYEENLTNKHLSVLIPLGTPEAGMNHVPVDYKFFCKNSCTHGMSRRATEMIFTLENDQNVILGRKKLEIRICSCPKRDKDKEELEYFPKGKSVPKPPLGKKRKQSQHVTNFPLKKKQATADIQVHRIHLDIVGQDNLLSVLKYASDVMSGSAIKTDNLEAYKPYIDQINSEIQQRMEQ